MPSAVHLTPALLLLLLAVTSSSADDNPAVGVIADWGGLPLYPYVTPYETSLARSLSQMAATVPVQAVLGLGDNFYFNGVASVDDKRFYNTFESVFSSKNLQMPWYFVAGNHDWRGNVSAQIQYSARSKRWNFPDYFYTKVFQFNNQCVAFVMIDTVVLDKSLAGEDPLSLRGGRRQRGSRYLQWIEQQLEKYQKCPYLFVAGHFPVWSIGSHGPTDSLTRWLDPLLIRYRVSAYLCGHEHNMQHIMLNGTDYFVAGAGNFVSPSTSHMHLFPDGSVKFYWNRLFDLDAAYLLLTFGKDHANATFHEATANSDVIYTHRLLPRVKLT